MTIFVDDEVTETRGLHWEDPETYAYPITDFIPCENLDCDNKLEVFKKDAKYTWFYCELHYL
jgi:hypothetical protein